MVIKDKFGNQFGSMYEITGDNTFRYTVAAGFLTVLSVIEGEVEGATKIIIDETVGEGNKIVYKIGSEVASLTVEDIVTDGATFVSGDTEIKVKADQYITIYEINSSNKVVRYVSRKITEAEIRAAFPEDLYLELNSENGTVKLNSSAMEGVPDVWNLVIPEYLWDGNKNVRVVTIGEKAFADCLSLSSVIIPDSVTSIDNEAFTRCYNLSSVVIPNSVISLGHSAFRACKSLSSVIIPNSVTSIGAHAFYSCTSITSLANSHSLTTIEMNAFRELTSLSSIVIPDLVKSIKRNAFYDSTSLLTLTIGSEVDLSGNIFEEKRNSFVSTYYKGERRAGTYTYEEVDEVGVWTR